MKVEKTPFEGLLIITPTVFTDDRGYFFESWNQVAASPWGLPINFAQDNESLSKKGVLRGLHFQTPPFEQGKLVRVIAGAVLDVVVDLRKNQETYGQHYKIELSQTNKKMLYIPPGFAHGFVSLDDQTIFVYKCTQVYNRECDRSIRYNDPILAIDWEISNPILSEKDRTAPPFSQFQTPFE
ncbi:MAG TPA: dTDP-4-dehydrorhamnose 3,5-epimerase [Bacteroidales bacterium]|nr:dTDP-4-dehydrorhamnose 3,5-epimerase [Bacteroidales bacterium]